MYLYRRYNLLDIVNKNRKPMRSAPNNIPEDTSKLISDDIHTIKNIRHHIIFIWLENGERFWFYPVYFGKRYIYGYRWTGAEWVYSSVLINGIESYF